jgi:hypothetical protein
MMASRSDAALDQGEMLWRIQKTWWGSRLARAAYLAHSCEGDIFGFINATNKLGRYDINAMPNKTSPAMPSGIYKRLSEGG